MGRRNRSKSCGTIAICLGLIGALAGCRSPSPGSGQGAESKTGVTSTQVVTGTVRYIDTEGGFYGIVTDDGKKLDPVNLPQEFQKDGLRLRAQVEPLKERVSIRMWGTPVRIIEFQRLMSFDRQVP